jgi:two-component system OmpR family sensor kinase
VTVRVTDNGPGIPAREQERVFEPFHRLNHTHDEGVSGTGIGLSIARTLARLHGGDIRVSSAASGATFTVTLHTESP